MKIADLRQEYMRAGLSEADIASDPLAQFERWFDDAVRAGVPLANAMTLATVDAAGAPSARIVLLKGIEKGAFAFYTNYQSRKARELEARGGACLVFMWSQLERQVRIDGTVERVSAAESDAYFASRPLGARHSAWASPQSERVPDRGTLERAMQAAFCRSHASHSIRQPASQLAIFGHDNDGPSMSGNGQHLAAFRRIV